MKKMNDINRVKKIKKSKISSKLKKVFKGRIKKIEEEKKQIKRRKIKKNSWFKKIIYLSLILFFILTGVFLLWVSSLKIPNIQELQNLKMSQATKIYDRTGKVILYNIYEDEKRTIVPLSKISKNIQNATISIEDKNFYEHDGTQIHGLFSSAINHFINGKRLRGASTITQQVIKQTLLTPERSLKRKVKELILSWRFESIKEKELGSKKKAKDSILEMYLNENPYGGTIYGVEEASNYYFGKHSSEVGIAEAAYLASMPQAPTTYSPYGKHRAALDKRKNLVLRMMLNQGYINLDEYRYARKEKVNFVFRKKDKGIKAPHFVMYVKGQLEKIYSPEKLKSGGLKVYTTLDYELQEKIQKIVKKNIEEAEAKKLGVSNGAVVAINPKTGEVLAMIGSKDYFAEDIDGKFNVSTAKRQPGSTFKTFAYLTAFQRGYTPKTVLWDVKTEFSDYCNPNYIDNSGSSKNCYHPFNFDHKHKGNILMEQALPESRNIPAIKTLYLAGLNNTFKNIKLMGIESLDKKVSHYGLSLVLGAGEVKLLNLVSAYGVLGNNGQKVEKRSILKVEDSSGKIIFESKKKNENIISKRVSLIISRILSDNKLKYPTFGWNSPLYFKDREVASKTGTTNDDKDFWVIGYNPGDVALGVWVGNNDNKPGKGKANYYTKRIWRESMEEALKSSSNYKFERVEENYSDRKPVLRGEWKGNSVMKIDITTGLEATETTPEEYVKEVPIPEFHSILYWVNPDNPGGSVPETKDRSYDRWEYGVQDWIKNNTNLVENSVNEFIDQINEIKENVDFQESGGYENQVLKFKILSPKNNDEFTEDENVFLDIEASPDIKKFLIYINGRYIASSVNGKINIDLSGIEGLQQENKIMITAMSNTGKNISKVVNFRIR